MLSGERLSENPLNFALKEKTIMNIDEYFNEVENAVSACVERDISSQEYVEKLIISSPEKIKSIIALRKEFLCASDYEQLGGYLEIFCFTQYDYSEKIALFSFMFEVGNILKAKLLRNRFQRYEENQPLFSKDSSIFKCIRKDSSGKPDLELIDDSCLENIQESEIFCRSGFFYLTDPFLNPALYTLCQTQFKGSQIYIRLDPTVVYCSQPLFRLNEEILIPANPNWWKNLNIYRRDKEGASYFLYEKELTKNTYQEFCEFKIKGIRRLDVVAKRNNSGNLSMMVEELSDKDADSGLTIGRCIHLDTDDPIGTSFNDSIVNHLDLAINVYEKDSAKKRYNDNLATGSRTEDATFRTHLLRIEKIPLKSIFLFAIAFFQSKTLIRDWFKDQFLKQEHTNGRLSNNPN